MVFGYFLLLLLPVAAVAYIIWDYKRKSAARNEVAAGRIHELLGTAAVQPKAATPSPPRSPAPVPAAPSAAAAKAAPAAREKADAHAAPLYSCRTRMLNPPQTLLYYLLRTALPDYNVYARVTLASILETGPGLTGFAREEQIRRLAALAVDFVVTDKSMRPLVVVDLSSPDQGGAAQADRDSVRTRVTAAGLRYIELDAKQLPRKDAVRALVLADTPSAETARSEAGVET